jgi:KAP family P-loop domain
MNFENCKYIISCDKSAIEKHLANAFKFEGERISKEFLSKFFQIELYVPAITWGNLADYTEKLLKECGVSTSPVVSEIISLGLKQKNPRKVRQHLNNALAFYKSAKERERKDLIPKGSVTGNINFIFKFIILRDEYPEFFQALEMDESLLTVAEVYLSGNSQGYPEEELKNVSNILDVDLALRNFLLNTRDIKTDSLSKYLYLHPAEFDYLLDDNREFKDKLLELNQDTVITQKLFDKEKGSIYLQSLTNFLTENIRHKRYIFAGKCIYHLLNNFDQFSDEQQLVIKNKLESLLEYDPIVQRINDFKKIAVLKKFRPSAREKLLLYYSNRLIEKNEFAEVLNNLFDVREILSSGVIRSMNEKLSILWGTEPLRDSIVHALKNKNAFVTDYFMNILIDSIETANIAKGGKQVSYLLEFKGNLTSIDKRNFGSKLIEILKTGNNEQNNNIYDHFNEAQNLVISTVKQLPNDFFATEEANGIYDNIIELETKIYKTIQGKEAVVNRSITNDIFLVIGKVWINLSKDRKESFFTSRPSLKAYVEREMDVNTLKNYVPDFYESIMEQY